MVTDIYIDTCKLIFTYLNEECYEADFCVHRNLSNNESNQYIIEIMLKVIDTVNE